MAHEEGNLNSFAAVLGNDVAIKAYREGSFHSRTARSLPLCTTVTSRRRKTTKSLAIPIFRRGTRHEHSVYGQGFEEVRRDGRLGFAHFIDGKPSDAASMKSCFPCHNQIKARDLVFTRYAP